MRRMNTFFQFEAVQALGGLTAAAMADILAPLGVPVNDTHAAWVTECLAAAADLNLLGEGSLRSKVIGFQKVAGPEFREFREKQLYPGIANTIREDAYSVDLVLRDARDLTRFNTNGRGLFALFAERGDFFQGVLEKIEANRNSPEGDAIPLVRRWRVLFGGEDQEDLPTVTNELELAAYLRNEVRVPEDQIRKLIRSVPERSENPEESLAVVVNDPSKDFNFLRFTSRSRAIERGKEIVLFYRPEAQRPVPGEEAVSHEEVKKIVKNLLARKAAQDAKHESDTVNREIKKNYLEQGLRKLSFLNIDRVEEIDFEVDTRRVAALEVDFNPRGIAADEKKTVIIPLETFTLNSWGFWYTWKEGVGWRETNGRFENTQNRIRFREFLLSYYSRFAETSEQRSDAKRACLLLRALAPLGYEIYPSININIIGIRTIAEMRPAGGHEFWDLGFYRPLSFGDNWMSQWSDFPLPVRRAILEVYPEEVLVASVVERIFREVAERENAVFGKYIGFVQDWLALPPYIQDRVRTLFQEFGLSFAQWEEMVSPIRS